MAMTASRRGARGATHADRATTDRRHDRLAAVQRGGPYVSSGVRPPTMASSRILVGFWNRAAVLAFSVEMVAPIGKVGWMPLEVHQVAAVVHDRDRGSSLPFFASATAVAATTLALRG